MDDPSNLFMPRLRFTRTLTRVDLTAPLVSFMILAEKLKDVVRTVGEATARFTPNTWNVVEVVPEAQILGCLGWGHFLAVACG
jgi:hypothetical protein